MTVAGLGGPGGVAVSTKGVAADDWGVVLGVGGVDTGGVEMGVGRFSNRSSRLIATRGRNSPYCGSHLKYCFPKTVPSDPGYMSVFTGSS